MLKKHKKIVSLLLLCLVLVGCVSSHDIVVISESHIPMWKEPFSTSTALPIVWTFAYTDINDYGVVTGWLPNQHPQNPEELLSDWGGYVEQDHFLFDNIEITTYRYEGQEGHYTYMVIVQNEVAFYVICAVNKNSLDMLMTQPWLFFNTVT